MIDGSTAAKRAALVLNGNEEDHLPDDMLPGLPGLRLRHQKRSNGNVDVGLGPRDQRGKMPARRKIELSGAIQARTGIAPRPPFCGCDYGGGDANYHRAEGEGAAAGAGEGAGEGGRGKLPPGAGRAYEKVCAMFLVVVVSAAANRICSRAASSSSSSSPPPPPFSPWPSSRTWRPAPSCRAGRADGETRRTERRTRRWRRRPRPRRRANCAACG